MYKTIFKYLEQTCIKHPNKIAFSDSKGEISYQDFLNNSKIIASEIIKKELYNNPIAIFLDNNIKCLTSMMGINFSGNFYTVIDNKMPIDRVKSIFSTLQPKLIITDEKNKTKLSEIKNIDIIDIDSIKTKINQKKLDEINIR